MPWAIAASIWALFIAVFLGLYYLYSIDFFIIINNSIEFASVLITAATLVLTAVAVMIAILAFYGFQNIKRAAIISARGVARTEAQQTAKTVAETEARRVAYEVAPSIAMQAVASLSATSTEDAEQIATSASGNHE